MLTGQWRNCRTETPASWSISSSSLAVIRHPRPPRYWKVTNNNQHYRRHAGGRAIGSFRRRKDGRARCGVRSPEQGGAWQFLPQTTSQCKKNCCVVGVQAEARNGAADFCQRKLRSSQVILRSNSNERESPRNCVSVGSRRASGSAGRAITPSAASFSIKFLCSEARCHSATYFFGRGLPPASSSPAS